MTIEKTKQANDLLARIAYLKQQRSIWADATGFNKLTLELKVGSPLKHPSCTHSIQNYCEPFAETNLMDFKTIQEFMLQDLDTSILNLQTLFDKL